MTKPGDEASAAKAPASGPRSPLSPAAARALAEAAARHAERERAANEAAQQAKEVNGRRGGPDPVRYGDWEIKGLASDF